MGFRVGCRTRELGFRAHGCGLQVLVVESWQLGA